MSLKGSLVLERLKKEHEERQGYGLLTGIGGELAVQEVVEGTRGLVLTSEQHHGFLGATHLGRCPGPGPLEV